MSGRPLEVASEPPADPDGVGVEPSVPTRVVTRLGAVGTVGVDVVFGVVIVEMCQNKNTRNGNTSNCHTAVADFRSLTREKGGTIFKRSFAEQNTIGARISP